MSGPTLPWQKNWGPASFFKGEIACPGEIGSPIDISLKVGANSAQAELTQSRMSRYDFCASRTPLLFSTPMYRPLTWLGVILFVAFYTKPWISSLQQLYFRRSNFKLGFLIKFPSPVVICHRVGASFVAKSKRSWDQVLQMPLSFSYVPGSLS